MKKILRISFIGLMLSLFVFSCTVERRLHNSGFHVKWNKSYDKSEADQEVVGLQNSEVLKSEPNNQIQVDLNLSQIENVNSGLSVDNESENVLEVNSEVTVVSEKEVFDKVSFSSKVAQNQLKKVIKVKNKEVKNKGVADDEMILLVILCFLLPPIAVGLKTNWDSKKLIINIILTLLCGIPGVIHALLVVLDEI